MDMVDRRLHVLENKRPKASGVGPYSVIGLHASGTVESGGGEVRFDPGWSIQYEGADGIAPITTAEGVGADLMVNEAGSYDCTYNMRAWNADVITQDVWVVLRMRHDSFPGSPEVRATGHNEGEYGTSSSWDVTASLHKPWPFRAGDTIITSWAMRYAPPGGESEFVQVEAWLDVEWRSPVTYEPAGCT